MSIADIRKEYKMASLSEDQVDPSPIIQFDKWWREAVAAKIDEVNAMTLATVAADGRPSARIVLLKEYTGQGFVFFTNYFSRKGTEISGNAVVALLFFWKELERQVRIEGSVKLVSTEESDEYFASRPKESKLGAWASPQSKIIESREQLEMQFNQAKEKFKEVEIPRPPHWGGYRVVPDKIEFWQGRPGRLHDRILYTADIDASWNINRLSP
ncbi:pyridoxamine 5'-phosphate oxidase [Pollutibacter soli]|uniref:pyridoxamine 5'-phosphate oxidase n=1 Tax=Pollutibacter soli TaxID=3034157 RepID=UPI003013CFA1